MVVGVLSRMFWVTKVCMGMTNKERTSIVWMWIFSSDGSLWFLKDMQGRCWRITLTLKSHLSTLFFNDCLVFWVILYVHMSLKSPNGTTGSHCGVISSPSAACIIIRKLDDILISFFRTIKSRRDVISREWVGPRKECIRNLKWRKQQTSQYTSCQTPSFLYHPAKPLHWLKMCINNLKF